MTDTQRNEAILLSNDATGTHWQLGPLPPRAGEFTLLGWTLVNHDGGVPDPVVNVLACALVQCGRVTFPCSAVPMPQSLGWRSEQADFVGTFPLRAVRGWRIFLAALCGRSELPLLSTTREEAVHGLFDDPAYPWHYQGQFALLSRPAAIPPNLSVLGEIPGNIIEPDWADALSELRGTGVESIIRPGVDGSVVGLLCTSHELRQEVEESIYYAASTFGLACRHLSEEAFAASLAIGK